MVTFSTMFYCYIPSIKWSSQPVNVQKWMYFCNYFPGWAEFNFMFLLGHYIFSSDKRPDLYLHRLVLPVFIYVTYTWNYPSIWDHITCCLVHLFTFFTGFTHPFACSNSLSFFIAVWCPLFEYIILNLDFLLIMDIWVVSCAELVNYLWTSCKLLKAHVHIPYEF